jgi:DNA-binding response OmpR family regulator
VKTIVIVDDEEELRDNLQDLLEFKGYRVISFPTGEAVLAEIDSIAVDLVLLDIQLPGIDGMQVLERLRLTHPTLPIAMVSASSIPSVLEEAKRKGANQTILKPYSHTEMLKAIHTLLGETEGS